MLSGDQATKLALDSYNGVRGLHPSLQRGAPKLEMGQPFWDHPIFNTHALVSTKQKLPVSPAFFVPPINPNFEKNGPRLS